jgi:hypothetical protein
MLASIQVRQGCFMNKQLNTRALGDTHKAQAQRRAEQVAAFNAELAELEREGLLQLPPDQRSRIAAYHQGLLQQLRAQFDIDLSSGARHLSMGMQAVSFLGAWALAASVFFLFRQYWGYLPTFSQVGVLVAGSLATLGLTWLLHHRDRTGYFAKLAALIAFTCFALNIVLLGHLFNITPTPNAFLLFTLYAGLLAYALNVRLLLAVAMVCLFCFVGAKFATWGGAYWVSMGERPENFLLLAVLLFWLPSVIGQERHEGFATIYRQLSMAVFFLALLVLSNWGEVSYLPWQRDFIEGFYQLLGFAASAGVIWLGVRLGWPKVMAAGNVYFFLFLFTKFFDWWWDWLPKFLFFFLIGLTALLALLIFSRLRRVAQPEVLS